MLLEDEERGAVLTVRVVPRSSKNRIVGVVNGSLRVQLAAPPVDGAANAALVELLAAACSLPKSRVRILSGEKAKQKRVLLLGADSEMVRATLSLDDN